ncbi:MAG TPA: GH25 family lysozyme [Longimicrobium sp.]|nr:GH25 family lysozyme [Longimicrobium sp.]
MFESRRAQARLRTLAIVAALAAAAVVAAYALLSHGYIRFVYPAWTEFPVRGVDISHHNGRVDWTRVRAAGYQFAYLKATEGATFRDSTYLRNRDAARRAGFVTGPYHFFTLCTPGRAQAQNLLSAQPGDAGASLPPGVDLEFGGNCGARPPRDSVLAEVGRFLAVIDSAYGRPAVLYVTREFHAAYLQGGADHPLWVRSVFTRPRFGREWVFWQYAATARVPGARGRTDLNVFRGTQAEFDALVRNHLRPTKD